MAVIDEIIRVEENGSLSFGNYLARDKQKKDQFSHNGDIYKVKTYNQATRLEKNDVFLMETVPGAAIHTLTMDEKTMAFSVESAGDVQVTIELEPETEYKLFVDNVQIGKMKTNISGKINFSVEAKDKAQKIQIEKL